MADLERQIVSALAEVTAEIEKGRETVRVLANEVAEVADIIEPALSEQSKRLRQARMATLDELRLIATGIREVSELLLSAKTEMMLTRAERFLAVMGELEDFRACGALPAFLKVFGLSLGDVDGSANCSDSNR